MMNENAKAAPIVTLPFSIPHSAFSILFTFLCYLAAGPTLGLFFGGFFVAAFLAPAASVRGTQLASVVAGIALVWLIPLFQTSDTFGQWLQLILVLASFALALAAISGFFEGIRIHPVFAAGAATVLGLLWLTWPIWLSPQFPRLSANLIERLVSIHPPLLANGVLQNEPPWTERLLAYRLTRLNQDTPIRLPTNIWPCVGVQLGIGGILLVVRCGIGRFLRRWPARD